MKKVFSVLFSLLLFHCVSAQKLFEVKGGKYDIFNLIDKDEKSDSINIESFEISNEVTVGQYLGYLKATKSDFSNKKFPYALVLDLKEYSLIPGVSWKEAMDFCKWLTLQNQSKDSMNFIYRLPTLSEWLTAYSQKKSMNGLLGFDDKRLSEWTLNSKDEAHYLPTYKWEDYINISREKDPSVLKRKIVIGNSYLISLTSLHNYVTYDFYEDQSYSHIGFRVVKVYLNPNDELFSPNNQALKAWGLN